VAWDPKGDGITNDTGTRVATESASGVSNRSVFLGDDTSIGEVRKTDRGVEFFSADERALFGTPDAGDTGSDRNPFTGPGFFQVDLGLFKNFTVAGVRMEFRTEIFNLLDTVNFSQPTILATSGNFGFITSTRVPPRIIQFGLKAYF
jgi:hypothetical protein